MVKDYSEEDALILEAIRSYPGIPNANNLSKESGGPIGRCGFFILERLQNNPLLQEAADSVSLDYVRMCDRAIFDANITTTLWINVSPKIREAMNARLDGYILESIPAYLGVPLASNLPRAYGGPLEYSETLIRGRLESNPELASALASAGFAFVRTCDRKSFYDNLVTRQWTQARGEIRKAIDARIDEDILEAIQVFQGIPTVKCLSKIHGGTHEFGPHSIMRRIKRNPALAKAIESAGINFVQTCDRATFDANLVSLQWINARGKIREAIHTRLDAYLLEAIRIYPGIPGAKNLSKAYGGPLEYGSDIITSRLDRNPALAKAMESTGIRFVQTCDRATFDASTITLQWNPKNPKIRAAIDARLDAYILSAIKAYTGIPSVEKLQKTHGGPLPYGEHILRSRLRQNAELRKCLLRRRGLTEDQVNALGVEHESQSPALLESVRRRLPNMRVFREAIGLLRQFPQVFKENTVEVSFYPEPLSKASALLGLRAAPSYVPAYGLKRPDFRFEEGKGADALMLLQCCHRLSNEALVNAFNEANRILSDAGVLLLTLPREYSKTDLFGRQVQDFGFELKTEGELHISTLTIQELAAMSIPKPGRLKQKIEQTTNVFLFVKTKPAEGKALDGFVLPQSVDGNGVFMPSNGEINTPPALLRSLSAAFREKRPALGNGFLLTVLDDDSYASRDLIAYDMNPVYPRKVEICPDMPPALSKSELRGIFKKIHTPSFREKALIREGYESRVPVRRLRSALAA